MLPVSMDASEIDRPRGFIAPLDVFRGTQRTPVIVLLLSLGILATVAWVVTVSTGATMTSAMMASMVASGNLSMFEFFLLVWGVMMTAMMFPSAAPMIQAYVRLSSKKENRRPWLTANSAAFLGTYAGAWVATGLVAGSGYLLLGRYLNGFAASGSFSPTAVGAVLIAAGVYQATPLKDACLRGCRTPISFLLTRWRPGLRGAVDLGARHAAYCIGCCWMLFAVLFVVGVMAIAWMALLAALIFVEKLFVGGVGRYASLGIGGGVAALGVAVLLVPAWTGPILGL